MVDQTKKGGEKMNWEPDVLINPSAMRSDLVWDEEDVQV